MSRYEILKNTNEKNIMSKSKSDSNLKNKSKEKNKFRHEKSKEKSKTIKNMNDNKLEKKPLEQKPLEIKIPEKIVSPWILALNKKKEENNNNKYLINPKDEQNWKGNIWIGPYALRRNKCQIEYSRDGVNWFNTRDETFSPEELRKMKEEEEQEENEKCYEMQYKLYLQRKRESDEYFLETGEYDSFRLAQIDEDAYESYLKELEKKNIEDETLDESEIEEEEYLDSD